jgi:Kef-type K+ transport system membrane component KefB
VVLGVTVAEDIVLYVVLAVALGFAQGSNGALGGLQLDLLHGFNIAFFMLFLVLACAIKAGSVTSVHVWRKRPAAHP